MEPDYFRQPTYNELLYLKRALANKKFSYDFAFYGLLACAVFWCVFILFVLFISPEFAIFLITLTGIFYLISRYVHLREMISDGKKINNIESKMIILPIEGIYRRKRFGRRGVKDIVYIGDYSFCMPKRWFRYLHEGDYVRAEAFFLPYAVNQDTGIVTASDPICVLVSLNDTYFIDPEVRSELSRIKNKYVADNKEES